MHTQSKNFLEKKQVVNEIKNKISHSQAIYLAEYRGLTVAQVTKLRFQAAEMGVDLKVYKNRLFKIATTKDHPDLDNYLTGPNVFIFSNESPVAGAKLIYNFAKKNPALTLKAGIYENQVIDAAGVKAVAKLPTYEEALTILASSLLGALRQVALSFKLLVDENKLPN